MTIGTTAAKLGGGGLMGLGLLTAGFGLATGGVGAVAVGAVEAAAGRYTWSLPERGL